MQIRLYIDEDAMDDDLVQALRLREIDVETALEAGMRNRPDDQQLTYARAAGRVLYTFNVGDFMSLHTAWVAAGQAHAGIVFGDQQRYSVGEQMRRLQRIIILRSAEAMQNSFEFLSTWV